MLVHDTPLRLAQPWPGIGTLTDFQVFLFHDSTSAAWSFGFGKWPPVAMQ
ncbi:MAG: hypothetical protein ACRDPO_16535 [Streptosporangiaceae bacterium]